METEAEVIEVNPWQIKQGTTFPCPICNYTRKTESQLRKHMHVHDDKDEESSHLCNMCPFQTNNKDLLKQHVDIKHKGVQDKERATIQEVSNETPCTMCNMNFKSKTKLNIHKKEIHNKSLKPCRNFPTNSCEYDDECNFTHTILSHGQHMCFKCGDILENKSMMIKHIKTIHGQELCKKFKDNKCDFGERCFYKHIINPAQVVTQNLQVPPPQYTHQVFPNLPATGQQALMVGDQKMYKMMNQMMSEMMKQMNLNK